MLPAQERVSLVWGATRRGLGGAGAVRPTRDGKEPPTMHASSPPGAPPLQTPARPARGRATKAEQFQPAGQQPPKRGKAEAMPSEREGKPPRNAQHSHRRRAEYAPSPKISRRATHPAAPRADQPAEQQMSNMSEVQPPGLTQRAMRYPPRGPGLQGAQHRNSCRTWPAE